MARSNCSEGSSGVSDGGVGDVGKCPLLRGVSLKIGNGRSNEGFDTRLLAMGNEEAGGGGVWCALPGLGEGGIGEGFSKRGESGRDSVIGGKGDPTGVVQLGEGGGGLLQQLGNLIREGGSRNGEGDSR